MTPHPEIGPRQTVDRACHPTLGEGRLVHRNGPAFFVADSGDWVALNRVAWAGSQAIPCRSWYVADQNGERLEIEQIGQGSEIHDRVFAQTHGRGWLTNNVGGEVFRHRFQPDVGETFEIDASVFARGLPDSGKDIEAQDAAREAGWMWISDGMTTLAWCDEADVEKAFLCLKHRSNQELPNSAKDHSCDTSGNGPTSPT